MEYYKSEIKIGIIAVFCISVLVFATFSVGSAKMFGSTYPLNVVYKNVGGLEPDAPVYYAGLEVGMVKGMRVLNKSEKEKFPDYTVIVNITADKLVQIRKDSKILIKTLGFMGLRYIDITPGSENEEIVSPKSTVKGETSQDINEVMESVGQIVNQIKPKANSIVTGIDNLVGEKGSIQSTITDLQKLINNADDVIVVNKEDIRKIIVNLSAATENLKQFAEDIKEHPWKLLIKSSDKPKKKADMPSEQKPAELKSFTPRRRK